MARPTPKSSGPRLAALLLTAVGAGCVLAPDSDGDTTANADGSGESTAGNATSPGTPTTTDPTTGAEPDPDSSSSGGSDDPGNVETGDPPPTDCSMASLWLGNPYYDGELGGSNPTGHGRLDDPPLRSRHLGVVDGRLAVETQTEVWILEDDLLRRVAGNEISEADRYRPVGDCADARFLVAEGIAGLPDGRLVVADPTGGGVVELSDPLADDCIATPIAGNQETTLAVDIDEVGAPGDIDGPGSEARFWGVSRPVADDDGNVYVIDRGNGKIKRIADDPDRTVTTLLAYNEVGNVLAMTVLDGVLYFTGTSGVDDGVWALDPATGELETLFVGSGLFDEIPDDNQAMMFSLANDGVDLLVGTHQGYVMRLSTAAFPLGPIAGYGHITDYPPDLDVGGPIPTTALPIDSYSGSEGSLVRLGTDILVSNLGGGTGYHVWSVHCE